MTLVKAYTTRKDFDYYKQFCKEGVSDTMVSYCTSLNVPGMCIFPLSALRPQARSSLLNVFQGVATILSQGLCPAMLTPSVPCEFHLC